MFTGKQCNLDSRSLFEICKKMAWLKFGSVFPLLIFLYPFFVDFFFFYSRCPHVPACPSSPLFRVVGAPHGALTAALWANVGSRVSRNSSGKVQLPWFCEIVFPLFGGMSIGSAYTSSWHSSLVGPCSSPCSARIIWLRWFMPGWKW